MSATKICSSCGETSERQRLSLFKPLTLCRRCQKRYRASYFALFVLSGFCLLTGFFIGRATVWRQPFTFLGTPIELQNRRDSLQGAGDASSEANFNQPAKAGESQQIKEATTPVLCGAPTRSGHPCRRPVRGGGYCWQHKDKEKARVPAALPPTVDATHASP